MAKTKDEMSQEAVAWQRDQPVGDVRYQAALLAVLAARFGITEETLKAEIAAEVAKRL